MTMINFDKKVLDDEWLWIVYLKIDILIDNTICYPNEIDLWKPRIQFSSGSYFYISNDKIK